MNQTFNRKDLLAAVRAVMKAMPRKINDKNKILGHVLIKGGVVTATDLDLRISVPVIMATQTLEQVFGEVALDAKGVVSVLTALTTPQVTIVSDTEGHGAKVNGLQVNGLDPVDFPDAPGIYTENLKRSSIDAKSLSRALDQTLFATAKFDQKSILGAVYMEPTALTATDGSRLSNVAGVDFQGDIGAIVPSEMLNKVKPLIDKLKGVIQFTQAPGYLHVTSLDFSAVIRLTGGEYPRYSELFPSDVEQKMEFDRDAMIGALKVLKANLEPRTNLIKLDPETGVITNSTDSVTVPFKVVGDVKPFALNFKYFLEALESLNLPQVVAEMQGALKPIVFTENNYKHLLMPVQAR